MVETEESFTYAEFRDAFTKQWQLHRGRRIGQLTILGFAASAGSAAQLRFFWEDERGDRHYGTVSDLTAPSKTHNLLSNTHPDTLLGTVVQGDLIFGNTTPAWQRLVKGNVGDILSIGGAPTKPQWGVPIFTTTQIPHGHDPQSFNAAATLTTPPDPFTTSSLTPVNITGLSQVLTGRNAGQGLRAVIDAQLACKTSAGNGFVDISIDGVDQGLALPVTSVTYTSVTLHWEDSELNANTHTYQITGYVDAVIHTLSVASALGSGIGTAMWAHDAATALPVA